MNKILVTKSSLPKKKEYFREIEGLWESRWLTNAGEKHELLRKELKSYMDVFDVELVTNGHMALELAIQALGLTGEVITTPFTFASTTQAIVRNGLTPIFCDINPKDFTIDVNKIEDLITDKTSAILPVHVYGNVCDVGRIEEIAKKHNLKVIYDAAHVFGVKYKNRGIGSFGDASCFSFHATKVFNTIEGGAVTYNRPDVGNAVRQIRNFGISEDGNVTELGLNAKMNEFCAAMGLCNLRSISEEIEKRREAVERYNSRLKNIIGIQINAETANIVSNYAYYPIVIHEKEFGVDREVVLTKLSQKNIFARKYFYPLTSSFECYKNMFDINETPVAEYVADRVLCLPLYAGLTKEQVDIICDTICEIGKGK